MPKIHVYISDGKGWQSAEEIYELPESDLVRFIDGDMKRAFEFCDRERFERMKLTFALLWKALNRCSKIYPYRY
jgi:hypothetical protein